MDEITSTSLYKKLVELEVKLDYMGSNNKRNVQKFTIYTWWILFLTVINIFVHIFIGMTQL